MATTMEIRRIEAGEIITQPGIYEMPLAWYHDNCCDGPSVSSTGLRNIDLKSPLHFFDRWSGNPKRDTEKNELEGDHFRIGRAAHWLMLEPHRFEESIAVRPDIFDSWRTKESQSWRDNAIKAGLTILTPDELKRAKGIKGALDEHPWHKEGILGGIVEASIIWRDEKTGIWLKSRPDSMPIGEAFADLKCVADASPRAFERSIRDLGYDLQMALAGIGLYAVTGRTVDQFWIVAVESSRPHAIHVASLATNVVYWSRLRLRKALDTMAACLKDDYWPSYGEDGRAYDLEPFMAERFGKYQKAGLLPQDDGFGGIGDKD